ncbi:MAG TPA: TAT-variant-translocated molybdopterin oxidoreductase [Stellaceae bacterium]|nr:TAT-variant-translocated molybdopterin oxidoreductase [Stellaceae bacterium]
MTGAAARTYWRSLEELAESPRFAAFVAREVPRFRDAALAAPDRRRFLQLMAASIALAGLAGCGPEPNPRQLLPYVEQPRGIIPGRNRYYASAHTTDGYADGVLIAHQMGRPIKIEGNPDHPASLGAASAIAQASILTLYDPRRAQTIIGNGQISSWEGFVTALYERRRSLSQRHGDGLRLLTGTVTSPSLAAQIAAVQKAFPAMRWHQWEPLDRDNELEAATQTFGRPVELVFDPGAANVIFAVGSDLISAAPGWLAYARHLAARRRPAETGGTMSRIYAVESTPTLIGAKADHRLPLRPDEILAALHHLVGALGAGPAATPQAVGPHVAWLNAAAADLAAHKGRALVHAGREQSVEIHLLVNAINGALGGFGKTAKAIEPVAAAPQAQRRSLADLVADMHAGKVDTLLMFDTNPVYSAPADLEFAAALRRVPFSVSVAAYTDETALAGTWHIPAAHPYEAWSDARAFDGTATILQPQIRPLYDGHSALQSVSILLGDTAPDDYQIVRAFWRGWAQSHGAGEFAAFWREALRRGSIVGTASPPVTAPARGATAEAPPPAASPAKAPGLQLLFRPDDGNWDGRYADNAWLLEMPRPLTRLTWDNAALVAPATARRLGLQTHEVVEIATKVGNVLAPVFVLPGQAPDCITLPLGWGRAAGGLGAGVGFDAYRLRSAADPWVVDAVSLRKIGRRYALATTQGQDHIEGRDLIREATLGAFDRDPAALRQRDNQESLYPKTPYVSPAWAMAIDLNSCIGCQACTIACQAENNVPVVGKDQVLAGRVMHWLRIDRYYAGPPDNPETAFEPIPCMHCEDAPCEIVCPAHATVHDDEGLNLMVYNRCIGTRFCSNNCPYKVRRFNFYAYALEDDRRPESWNPEVTVRDRGVMEKCTYCIQRIKTAEIAADRENRSLRDGEIRTACQQSCPTQAIIFGNRDDPHSAVSRRKATPIDYVLLAELNTRPRTSYGALIRNPNPAIPASSERDEWSIEDPKGEPS